MKYNIRLRQSFPFAQVPAECTLDDDKILANDVIFEGECNPHGVRLFVIGHEFGAICAVWASCEHYALDAACHAGLIECLMVSEEDQASASPEEQEEWARLGNANEPADLAMVWIGEVDFEPSRDIRLMLALAEARGAGQDTLDK